MKSYSLTRCRDCGHEEVRYSNVKRCRNCGGIPERPKMEDRTQARLALARRIVAQAWLWAAHDPELRDLLRKWETT